MKDFFKDAKGDFSLARFWTSVAYSYYTYYMILKINDITMTDLITYAGILGGAEVIKKYITMNAK
tara:strand:- start:607 stop:801 length:195 start_codon:yes stop_codon:yes gene_type:complete